MLTSKKPAVEVRQVYIASPGGGYMQRSPPGPAPAAGSGLLCDLCGLCGLCQCGSCLSPSFLATPTGVVKVVEFLFGVICQLLLLAYGVEYTDRLGLGYTLFLTVNSGSALTTSVLLLCYIISPATYSRVRPSLFEVLLTGICCVLYITAATFLATAVYQTLYFTYHTVAGFSAYPALTAVYVLGYCAGIVHGVDCIMALKSLRSVQ